MNRDIDWDEIAREVRKQAALEYITIGRKNTSPEVRLQTPQLKLLRQICDLAKELGITKVDLCQQWHIAKRQIYYYLRGDKMPSPAIYERMKQTHYYLQKIKRESSGTRAGKAKDTGRTL